MLGSLFEVKENVEMQLGIPCLNKEFIGKSFIDISMPLYDIRDSYKVCFGVGRIAQNEKIDQFTNSMKIMVSMAQRPINT